ncbi:MAG TPA: hypothetical protein VFT04_11805 [Gemmatimonadales bacterium]|nr:hypothetical protein [Gemmatimonadales bacterium]
MTTTRRIPTIPTACALALLFVLACSDSVAPKGPVQHLVAVNGGGQTGATLDTLPDWLVVRVVNDGGEPLAGVPVIWSSEDETGRAIPVDPVTNLDGIARAIAVLGFDDGDQPFYAQVEGFDDRAKFSLTAVRPPGLKAISLMNSSGANHMCAIDAEGVAWCWGSNYYGQLGDGTDSESAIPRRVETTQRFRSIAGTWSTTCAIALDHSLWCWGLNAYGEGAGLFGNGSEESSSVPVRGGSGLLVSDIDMDFGTVCAVTTAAEAWCWGRIITPAGNDNASIPVKVESAEQWRDISVSGSDRVCAIAMDYEAWCWAGDEYRAATAGIAGDFRRPQLVSGVPPLIGISVSWNNQCGLVAAGGGAAVCWGRWPNGVASLAFTGYPRTAGGAVARIVARVESVLALGADGRLWMWGELPCCGTFYSPIPLQLPISGPWTEFALADEVPYGIMATDSIVYRWSSSPFSRGVADLLPHPMPAP